METKSEILNELKELSPTLFDLKQISSQPFKVPNGYFTQLQSELFTSIELGFSDDLGKKPFAVPNNYFDNLSDSIMDAIDSEEEKEVVKTAPHTRVIELNSSRKRQKVRPLKIYAMAAAIAGLLLFMTFLSGNIPINSTKSESTFSDAAIEYLEDNFDDIESEDLYALLDLSDESLDLSGTEVFQDDLNDYLIENIEDLDLSIISSEI